MKLSYKEELAIIKEEEIGSKLEKGKGCIVFDVGVFFPYNVDMDIKLNIGMEELPDRKINHRYNNKGYHTLVRKYGRKLSKIGYPFFFDLEKDNLMLLAVEIGWKSPKNADANMAKYHISSAKLIFPLNVKCTEEKPVCSLSFKLLMEEGEITFCSNYKEDDDIGWKSKYWSNDEEDDCIPLNCVPVEEGEEVSAVVYDTVIEPVPVTLESLSVERW